MYLYISEDEKKKGPKKEASLRLKIRCLLEDKHHRERERLYSTPMIAGALYLVLKLRPTLSRVRV